MNWKEELTYIAQQLIDSDHWWETDIGKKILSIIKNIPKDPNSFEIIHKESGELVTVDNLTKFTYPVIWRREKRLDLLSFFKDMDIRDVSVFQVGDKIKEFLIDQNGRPTAYVRADTFDDASNYLLELPKEIFELKWK